MLEAGKLATNAALRDYVQDRFAGLIGTPTATPLTGLSWYAKDGGPFIGKVGAGPKPGARNRSRGV